MSWVISDSSSTDQGSYVVVNVRADAYAPTITVSDGGTYDGSAHNATGSAVGLDGKTPVAGTFTYTYYTVTGGQIDPNSGTSNAPTTAGTYAVVAHFTSSDSNYTNGTAQTTFTINKAPSTTTTVGAGPYTYDGTTHAGGSGTVTGAGGLNTAATSLTYTGDQIDAGTYYVTAHYAGDANHLASDGQPVAITINKASSSVSVTDAGGTYDGTTAFAATATVSGAGTVTGSASVAYYLASDTTFSHPLSGAPVNAGSYVAKATYGGDANHTGSSNSVAFTVAKAASTTTTIGAGPFTYDGTTHTGGSGTVTGAGGLNTVATSLTYTGDQIDAGTYYVTAHYAGDANHLASDGQPVAITINKATPAFSLLSSPTIIVGTTSTTLSGKLSLGALVPTGGVSIGVSGVTVTATINSDGTFSATLPTGALGAGAYTISYGYGGDRNFNGASGRGTLDVTYGINVLFDQSHAKEAGSTIPIQLALTNAAGQDVSSQNTDVTVVGFAPISNPAAIQTAEAAGNSNPGNVFRLEGGDQGAFYQYNLKTPRDLEPGTYLLYFTIAGDPVTHSVQFVVK